MHILLSVAQIYGKTSRRQAIAKLRQSCDRDRAPPPVAEPQHRCCTLTDILVNKSVEIHEQSTLDSRFLGSRSKIASDTHNVSQIKLDVEKV